jgi:hypothetical protein
MKLILVSLDEFFEGEAEKWEGLSKLLGEYDDPKNKERVLGIAQGFRYATEFLRDRLSYHGIAPEKF